MKVVLTGATGFIGSHVLSELQEHGHEVTAFVRDDAQANTVAARGATPAVADLYDRAAVEGVLAGADGAIHTASPGDATSADLDSAVVDAVTSAFDGTGKPYLQISGLWVYGNNSSISEASAFNAPPLVAWKEPIERRVLGAKGMRGTVIVSTAPAGMVSCVVASAESVRILKFTSTEFLIDTPMQSIGATIAVHDTVSTVSCFFT